MFKKSNVVWILQRILLLKEEDIKSVVTSAKLLKLKALSPSISHVYLEVNNYLNGQPSLMHRIPDKQILDTSIGGLQAIYKIFYYCNLKDWARRQIFKSSISYNYL